MNKRQLQKTILSYPPLKDYLGDDDSKKKACLKNLDEIASHYSTTFIKKIKPVVDMILSKMYDGINLEYPNDLDLLRLSKENNLIFVPNHQSHVDYIALNYAFFLKYGPKVPIHIAGGINLNIFPIGPIFRKLGCFFIRRTFSGNRNYRYTFEAYIYVLLKQGTPIEFFFEGGRSRTGRLMPPRFGLFNMILDAHRILQEEGHKRPLLFVPVSIMHEFVPEEKSLTRELGGKKKKKESGAQLIKLLRIFSKQFGTIHIKVGRPISKDEIQEQDPHQRVYKLAFRCYRSVGAGMSLTPTSLLTLIMMDAPSGALTYESILKKTKDILDYCERFEVPTTSTLGKGDRERTMKRALELLRKDQKIKPIQKDSLNRTFYVVESDRRLELLYFKNSILHQFLTPFLINSIFIKMIDGRASTVDQLKSILKEQRDLLKYEFYLPDASEIIRKAFDIIHHAIGRKVTTFGECFELSPDELSKAVKVIHPFTSALNYIYEAHYVGCLGLKHLGNVPFTEKKFLDTAKAIHEIEHQHGRLIRFNESYSVPLLKNALKYYENRSLLKQEDPGFLVTNLEGIDDLIDYLTKYLTEHLMFNLKTLH
ncbi:MAG: 1-acyl-sn-glycerol-3-phosphate acyltransferase [Bacteriovoracales bacterium]|nr:1-acyl-sn-glycerol-3-phosphate acyltransferase [Bacteriovoracales bacterium]